jgi:hypothetical protein
MAKSKIKEQIQNAEINKKLPGGTIIVRKGKPVSFQSNDGGKNIDLVFNEEGKPHGICVINGQKFKFENGKFKK